MENEILISKTIPDVVQGFLPEQRESFLTALEALQGDGWKNSQIIVGDDSPGGGLRAAIIHDVRVVFRYAPELHSIIVVDIKPVPQELAVAV